MSDSDAQNGELVGSGDRGEISSSSDGAGFTALGEYCPFIADVPISSYAEPFPIANPDTRSEKELEAIRKVTRKILTQKKFNPPVPLADFCLVAKERWEKDDSDQEASVGLCLLV
jgi:hypothetical protein